MFILANILLAVARILSTVIWAYTLIVIIAVVVSWVRLDPYHPAIRLLHSLTEPVLWRLRKWLPFLRVGMLDLAPLVLILGLQFIDIALVQSLADLGARMRLGL